MACTSRGTAGEVDGDDVPAGAIRSRGVPGRNQRAGRSGPAGLHGIRVVAGGRRRHRPTARPVERPPNRDPGAQRTARPGLGHHLSRAAIRRSLRSPSAASACCPRRRSGLRSSSPSGPVPRRTGASTETRHSFSVAPLVRPVEQPLEGPAVDNSLGRGSLPDARERWRSRHERCSRSLCASAIERKKASGVECRLRDHCIEIFP